MSVAVPCTVWWTRPHDVSDAELALLSEGERDRYAALRSDEDRARFATARLIARIVLGRRVGIAPEDVELDATCPRCGAQHAKPIAGGRAAGLELSISHSGDRVAVAIAEGAQVGLDVEGRPALGGGDGRDLWEAVLRPGEQLLVARLPEELRGDAFLAVWTRKEAILKATGDGLDVAMTELEVSPATATPRVLSSAGHLPPAEHITLAELHPGEGYRATLAVITRGPIEVEEADAEVLLAGTRPPVSRGG
jgi:4'-phosphopantetheinyl transferase